MDIQVQCIKLYNKHSLIRVNKARISTTIHLEGLYFNQGLSFFSQSFNVEGEDVANSFSFSFLLPNSPVAAHSSRLTLYCFVFLPLERGQMGEGLVFKLINQSSFILTHGSWRRSGISGWASSRGAKSDFSWGVWNFPCFLWKLLSLLAELERKCTVLYKFQVIGISSLFKDFLGGEERE